MLVVDQEQTYTKRPKAYLHWQMVCWVKGLMNHPIFKDETNVGLLHTHTRGRGTIKVEQNSLKREYATTLSKNAIRERQKLQKGN